MCRTCSTRRTKNLFDKTYYDAIYDNGPFTVPGQKRRFILTGELKF